MDYKIVYFAFVSASFGGIEQKIIAQFDALGALGAEVHLFLISKYYPDETFAREIVKRTGVNTLVNSPAKISNPWAHRKEKFDMLTLTLQEFDPKNTIVYLRYPIADFLFLKFLKKNKEYRFITEHQDIENRLRNGIFRLNCINDILDILFGKAVRKRITGFVGVTTEITNSERSYISNQGHFFVTIGNGIDTTNYPLRCPRNEFQSNEIRILFVGAGYRPHGLSRLIKSIYLYYKNRSNIFQIHLKVAGDSKAMKKNRNLVNRLNLNSRVCFLGNIENRSLYELFDWAQIGCGSLAIHKKGLSFTSELKAREYCARGLPFFCSTTDQDFYPDFPYILKVPKSNGAFDLDPIISFAFQVTSDPTHNLKMRQYAIERLDWSVKMIKLVAFLDEINGNVYEKTNQFLYQ
jgi:glycosyltransferase involved in cell wall biosynthesis